MIGGTINVKHILAHWDDVCKQGLTRERLEMRLPERCSSIDWVRSEIVTLNSSATNNAITRMGLAQSIQNTKSFYPKPHRVGITHRISFSTGNERCDA